MRSARIERLGGPDLIDVRHVDRPVLGDHHVLVEVECTSVNHVDTFVRSGAWRTPLTFPFTVGRDAVGVVRAVGRAVTEPFAPGDRVWTNSLGHAGRDGAAADYVCVEPGRLYPVPEGIDPVAMAALCHPGATAHLALFRHGHLSLGQHLVVVGAGGNIGRLAVQMGRMAGARVTAVARGGHHPDLWTLGADAVLTPESARHVDAAADVDLVVDAAGDNDLTLWTSRLRAGGRVVLLAGMSVVAPLPVGSVYLNGVTVTGFTISRSDVQDLASAARGLCHAVTRGLVPPSAVVRPLEELRDAHADLESGRVRGKQVVTLAAGLPPSDSTTHHPEEHPCT